jgi:hypothetical protein
MTLSGNEDDPMTDLEPVWSSPISVDDVSDRGMHVDLAADEDARAEIAKIAGLRDLPKLSRHSTSRVKAPMPCASPARYPQPSGKIASSRSSRLKTTSARRSTSCSVHAPAIRLPMKRARSLSISAIGVRRTDA